MGNFKSSLVDGDFKVTGKTWLLDGNHIHTFNGESGKSGYVHFAQIKITGSYQNQPVIFDVIQRDRRGRITLLFKSLQGNDPVIVWFIKSGNLTYSISDPINFRNAINIKAMSASDYSSSASSLPNGSLVAVW